MITTTAVYTPNAPAPAHTFSQGIRKGPFLQVSGQGPVDAATNEYLHPGDVAAQTTLTLRNVLAVVEAGGGTFDDILMLRVYLTDRDDFSTMNDAYAAFAGQRHPEQDGAAGDHHPGRQPHGRRTPGTPRRSRCDQHRHD